MAFRITFNRIPVSFATGRVNLHLSEPLQFRRLWIIGWVKRGWFSIGRVFKWCTWRQFPFSFDPNDSDNATFGFEIRYPKMLGSNDSCNRQLTVLPSKGVFFATHRPLSDGWPVEMIGGLTKISVDHFGLRKTRFCSSPCRIRISAPHIGQKLLQSKLFLPANVD